MTLTPKEVKQKSVFWRKQSEPLILKRWGHQVVRKWILFPVLGTTFTDSKEGQTWHGG